MLQAACAREEGKAQNNWDFELYSSLMSQRLLLLKMRYMVSRSAFTYSPIRDIPIQRGRLKINNAKHLTKVNKPLQ